MNSRIQLLEEPPHTKVLLLTVRESLDPSTLIVAKFLVLLQSRTRVFERQTFI